MLWVKLLIILITDGSQLSTVVASGVVGVVKRDDRMYISSSNIFHLIRR